MASKDTHWNSENGTLKGSGIHKEQHHNHSHGRTAHHISATSLRRKSDLSLVQKFPIGWIMQFLANLQVVMLGTKLCLLFPAIPLAFMARIYNFGKPWVFAWSLLGLTPLAERVSFLTEQLAYFTSPTLGDFLNGTWGNATELIIAIYALAQRKVDVIKYSLLGSIISNILLVLGSSLFCGGIANIGLTEQEFNSEQAGVNKQLLALLCCLLPFIFKSAVTNTELAAIPIPQLSRASYVMMIITYVAFLCYQMNIHRKLFEVQESDDDSDDVASEAVPVISFWSAIVWLIGMTALVALLSDYVVATIEDASSCWGLSVSFICFMLLPMVENAVQHAGAVIFAFRNRLDISLAVALGAATRIALFVAPSIVIVTWIADIDMDLDFNLLESGSLAISILITIFMLRDGRSHYMKGLVLLCCYLVIGVCFYVLQPLVVSNSNILRAEANTSSVGVMTV